VINSRVLIEQCGRFAEEWCQGQHDDSENEWKDSYLEDVYKTHCVSHWNRERQQGSDSMDSDFYRQQHCEVRWPLPSALNESLANRKEDDPRRDANDRREEEVRPQAFQGAHMRLEPLHSFLEFGLHRRKPRRCPSNRAESSLVLIHRVKSGEHVEETEEQPQCQETRPCRETTFYPDCLLERQIGELFQLRAHIEFRLNSRRHVLRRNVYASVRQNFLYGFERIFRPFVLVITCPDGEKCSVSEQVRQSGVLV